MSKTGPAIGHVHLIEPAPNLGHGPLWLGYLIDALGPAVSRLTVSYPQIEAYAQVVSRSVSTHSAVTLRAFPWRSSKRAWAESLRGAKALQADLTLFTDIGTPLKRADEDLRELTGTPIWGIWFNPPARRKLSPWARIFAVSRRSRNAYREQRWLQHLPDWLAGVLVQDELLRERISPRPGLSIGLIPDPWPTLPTLGQVEARQQLGLPADRQLFLHLGVAAPRKGLGDTIAAWQGLEDCPDCLLLRAGSTDARDRNSMDSLIRSGRAILHGGWIAEAQLDSYLRASDWILLPYRRHEGSSGLLAGAAAAGRPVIAADYGVLGRRVASSHLGLVYPHGSVDGLAQSIRDAAATPADEFTAGLKAYSVSQGLDQLAQAVCSALDMPRPENTG